MEQNSITPIVREAVEAIKMAIHRTRYNIMRHANKEALLLYYAVGGYISRQASIAKWGDKVIDSISSQLQQEMPGLRGFSKGNIKKMRKFFEEWESVFGSLPTNQFSFDNFVCRGQQHHTRETKRPCSETGPLQVRETRLQELFGL